MYTAMANACHFFQISFHEACKKHGIFYTERENGQ